MSNIKVGWTAGLDAERAKEVEAAFKASSRLRLRLSEMLQNKSKTAHEKTLSASGYDSPSWAYTQADAVGYQRALKEVISLITSGD